MCSVYQEELIPCTRRSGVCGALCDFTSESVSAAFPWAQGLSGLARGLEARVARGRDLGLHTWCVWLKRETSFENIKNCLYLD